MVVAFTFLQFMFFDSLWDFAGDKYGVQAAHDRESSD